MHHGRRMGAEGDGDGRRGGLIELGAGIRS